MFFYLLVLICALSISGTGAYFSILGLATMFPGAATSVVAMGVVLEVGKIVAAIWLHLNWKVANKLVKYYLTAAVIVLMFITSMGIFGFLSKAHIEHDFLTSKESASVSMIEEKILREEQFIKRQESYIQDEEKRLVSSKDINLVDIEREEKRIEQLNTQLSSNIAFEQERLNQLSNRRKELDDAVAAIEAQSGGLFSAKKDKLKKLHEVQLPEREGLNKSITDIEAQIKLHRQKSDDQIKESLTKIASFQQNRGDGHEDAKDEIEKYNTEINSAVERISSLEVEKLSYDEKVRMLEAEVGPVKYIAKLFEDLGSSAVPLDKAVRMVIIVLIFVFDPLAVLLVLAGVSSIHSLSNKKEVLTAPVKSTPVAADQKTEKRLNNIEKKMKAVAAMAVSRQGKKKS
jgi:chromosome segregation ATPase